MHKERRPPYYNSVFTADEVQEIRRMTGTMRVILGLFIAIVVLIFIPFHTVSQLSKEVGALTAIVSDQKEWVLKDRDETRLRINKIEERYISLDKKFYWINRNSREANEKIGKLNDQLSAR
jgi:hypothetical protein